MSCFRIANCFVFSLFAVAMFSQVALADEVSQAARKGDAESLTALLSEEGGADPAVLARPLFFAAQSGHTDIVAILLDYGADPNATFEFGSALQKAARGNHAEIVELLLKAGAESNIHAGDKDYTPLHDAAERGSLEAAKLLVAYGADVNARERWGIPPIHLAIKKENVEMASFLAENGARPFEPASITDADLAVADLETGRIAAIGCSQCHIVEEGIAPSGQHNHGPPLIGIFGQEIATVDGFPYSSALAAIQGIWNVEELNRFIADPAGRVPGTNMELKPKLTDIERVALIAYLSRL